jgi:hypothetical protein
MGVAWLIYSDDRPQGKIDTSEETGDTPQYGSFLWREQREQKRASDGGPKFGIRDVVSF